MKKNAVGSDGNEAMRGPMQPASGPRLKAEST
jgi:hypothetical protein